MDLTMKILIAMCVQAIVGLYISFFNEIIGLAIITFAVGINFIVLVVAVVKFYSFKITKGEKQ